MATINEKDELMVACVLLYKSLIDYNPQEIAKNIALIHTFIDNFVDAGYVSYEAVDCELMELQKRRK